jgi:Aspartyl/Asparaginyl beta-hydroxylase
VERDVSDLLAGIRNGNYHAGGIRSLRLFRVERDFARSLRRDVDRICANEPGSDVQDAAHVTHWTRPKGRVLQFSLLNRSGDFADYRDDHDLSIRGKRFHHGERYPDLSRFIALFPHCLNFRINLLGPGAALRPHEEHSLFMSCAGTPAVRARFHLPVRTQAAARMRLDGQEFEFLPRTIYYFNQGCVHDAENRGTAARVHLVWDLLLTAEAFDLMFGSGVPPLGLHRIDPSARSPRVLERLDRVDYVAVPPLVTPGQARKLALCIEQ